MAVEGFLDLFDGGKLDEDENQSLVSSVGKNVPASALASVVLWCDAELCKFASFLTGPKVIGRLALSSANARHAATSDEHFMILSSLAEGGSVSKSDQQESLQKSIEQQKSRLKAAEDMGEFAVAAEVRRQISKLEADKGNQNSSTMQPLLARSLSMKSKQQPDVSKQISALDKERQQAINLAAKCIDEVFEYGSRYMDTIGLSLTARLAECIKPKLKGCETEIARLLEEKWSHVVFDWYTREPNALSGGSSSSSLGGGRLGTPR
mmetsp:Transcript_19837/g.22845  ORF Transcript_19837/g.22845 Transcript_19837/m.22845 type:complete len:265 (-) Transcript_19837:56-850(-)